jgi:RHS repeat-associated protein
MTEIKRYIDGGNDEIVLNNVQYDTRNFLTQAEYGNGLTATFSYDSLGRVLTLDIKDGQTSYLDLDYMYDNNSNITQLVNGWRDTNLNWHSDTESYSYDGLNRVTSADCTSWSHTYSYDKVGNRITKDSVTYTINTVNEVTDLNDGTSFVYDLNGNRIQKTKGTDTWDYTYDYVNRLIKIEENSSVTGEYVYDGDGNRLQKIENGETTTYIRRGTQVLYEENSNGSATYIYGPTGRIAKRTAINQEKNAFYYHKDHLDSTRLVTDSSKNIVAAIRYHPFGDIDIKEGSESYLYTGQEKDSGLYYYGARYYDCNVGRFITRDVYTWLPDDPRSGNTRENAKWLENPQKFNRFSYAQNNPVKYNDPTGFCCEMGNSRYREKVNMIETGRVSGIHRNFPIRMDLRRLGMMINPQENFRLRLNWGFRPLGGGRTCYVIVTDCNGEEQRTFKYKEGNEKERKEAMDKTIALIGFYRSSKCPLEYDVKCYTKDEDPHLDEICAGTFFICIFFALGILIVFVRYERKKPR